MSGCHSNGFLIQSADIDWVAEALQSYVDSLDEQVENIITSGMPDQPNGREMMQNIHANGWAWDDLYGCLQALTPGERLKAKVLIAQANRCSDLRDEILFGRDS